jgi:tetratricopeptide (TPR) repeat protein
MMRIPRRRLAGRSAVVLLVCGGLFAGWVEIASVPIAAAQDRFEPDPALPFQPRARADLLRRVQELDRLLTLGSLSRAEALLDELAQHSFLEAYLTPLRIRLAQLKGEHAEAVELCRGALSGNESNARLWRELAISLLALGRWEEAREALDNFIATSPNRRSSFVVAVDLVRQRGAGHLALALVDSARATLGDPRFLARERALTLLELDRQAESAEELSAELRVRPFNLPLVRTSLLDGPFDAARHERFVRRLQELGAEPAAGAAEAVLVANLLLHTAGAQAAVAAVARYTTEADAAIVVLQNAATLVRELELEENAALRAVEVDYLLAVLENLGTGPVLESSIRVRKAAISEKIRKQRSRGSSGCSVWSGNAIRSRRTSIRPRSGSPGTRVTSSMNR